MATAIIKNITIPTNVVSLCDYRAADAATRQQYIASTDNAAFPPGKFPGTDYSVISTDIAATAKLIRAGLVPSEALATWLDRLSTSAHIACRNVREYEDRALRAERQLKKTKGKAVRR